MTALILLLLKTLLVFAAAGLTLFAQRRASAAARHLVCLLTLAALLALPVLSLSLPGWLLLPALPGQSFPHSSNTGGTGKEAPPTQVWGTGKGTDDRAGASAAPTISNLPPPLLGAGRQNSPPHRPLPWPLFLLSVWAVGVVLALTRPLLGLRGIRQLSRLSVPVTDAPMQTLAAECAASLRLTRLPHLYQAAVPVPMTWGSRRPVVLLPLGAELWPEDRLRAVLLHELAHIRRSDWLAHRFADFVCALYWFHPLAWLTARRLRTESEAACDDLVLASGMAAPEYARHLLEIARALPPIFRAPRSAIAMAHTSQVERRLTMILDKTQTRRTLTRRALIGALGVSIISLVSLAVMRPVAKAQTALQSVSTPPAPEGSAQILGITDATAPGGKWWGADGKVLSAPILDRRSANSKITAPPGQKGLFFAFHLPAAEREHYFLTQIAHEARPGLIYSFWKGSDSKKMALTTMTAQETTGDIGTIQFVIAALPASLTQTDIRVLSGFGLWTTAATVKYPFGERSGTAKITGNLYQSCQFNFSQDKITFNAFSKNSGDIYDLRVIAVDKGGRDLQPLVINRTGRNNGESITAQLPQTLTQIKAFRVETRPFIWKEFKNVVLHPVK